MPLEAQTEQSRVVLLVGEPPSSLRASLGHVPVRPLGLQTLPNVYAAAAMLAGSFIAASAAPRAVLVFVESLRSDELRFFDMIARRWPALPVAAVYNTNDQDRRLDACRRKAIPVVAATSVADWLAGRLTADAVLDVAPAPSAGRRPVERGGDDAALDVELAASHVPPPDHSQSLSETPLPLHDADTSCEAADSATAGMALAEPCAPQPESSRAIHQLPDESFVDLPDDLVAHLPDHLDDLPDQVLSDQDLREDYVERELPHEDDDDLPSSQEDDPSWTQSEEDRPLMTEDEIQAMERPGDDLADMAGFAANQVEEQEPPPQDSADEQDARVPLTPWSDVPRPQRRKTRRTRSATRSQGPDSAGPSSEDHAVVLPPDSPKSHAPDRAPDYGLLTPEELRALLAEPLDEQTPPEAQV